MCCQPLLASTQAATDVAGEKNATRHCGDNATTRQGNKTNKRYKTTIQTNATACMFRVCIMFATPFSVCFETRHGSKLFDVSSGLVATICRHILGVLRVFRPRCTITGIRILLHCDSHASHLAVWRGRSVTGIRILSVLVSNRVWLATPSACSSACSSRAARRARCSEELLSHGELRRWTTDAAPSTPSNSPLWDWSHQTPSSWESCRRSARCRRTWPRTRSCRTSGTLTPLWQTGPARSVEI